jgi:arabinogalactan endo-1,4-beta-galactosidase
MNFWSIFKRRKEIRTLDEQIKKPIFGSEEERRERFLIIMERLDKKRVEFNVSNEEFNKRLEETKIFLKVRD